MAWRGGRKKQLARNSGPIARSLRLITSIHPSIDGRSSLSCSCSGEFQVPPMTPNIVNNGRLIQSITDISHLLPVFSQTANQTDTGSFIKQLKPLVSRRRFSSGRLSPLPSPDAHFSFPISGCKRVVTKPSTVCFKRQDGAKENPAF